MVDFDEKISELVTQENDTSKTSENGGASVKDKKMLSIELTSLATPVKREYKDSEIY
jgi:hypothetical protein